MHCHWHASPIPMAAANVHDRHQRRKEKVIQKLPLIAVSLEETRSHTLEMVQIFSLSFFVGFFVMFFVISVLPVIFFCHFFVVSFVISVLSVIVLSFFVVFFVISVLSVIYVSFSEDFFDLFHYF
jgi:uncharacterized membrane protein